MPTRPEAASTSKRTVEFVKHLTRFAENGEVDVNAILYIIGAIVQLIAAPRAANSPIIFHTCLTAF